MLQDSFQPLRFPVNKCFPERLTHAQTLPLAVWNYCVTTCRFAYLHTVTVWQTTVLTETRTWKFCFLEQTQFLVTLSTLFTYAKRATSHGIAEFSNKIIEWKATCPKLPLRERSWCLTNKQMQQLKCHNLRQDLHKTVTSLIHRMNCWAAPFICENLGTWQAKATYTVHAG